jgi:hypothetical protein
MVERPRVDLVSIVARIKRGPVDEDDAAEAEVAVDVLDFLDHACKATGCEPGWTAKLTVLDLCAAIVGFGAARNVNEVANSKGGFSDAPPCSCLSTPQAVSWH